MALTRKTMVTENESGAVDHSDSYTNIKDYWSVSDGSVGKKLPSIIKRSCHVRFVQQTKRFSITFIVY